MVEAERRLEDEIAQILAQMGPEFRPPLCRKCPVWQLELDFFG